MAAATASWRCWGVPRVKHDDVEFEKTPRSTLAVWVRTAGSSAGGDPGGGSSSSSSASSSSSSSSSASTSTSSSSSSASSSSTGEAPLQLPASCADAAQEEWHDCAEAWETAQDEQDEQAAAHFPQQRLLDALPDRRLARLVQQFYEGGLGPGCKAAVAFKRWLQDSGTSLEQLQAQLQPLLAAEAALPPQLPTPTPRMSAAAHTAALRAAAAAAAASSADGCHASGPQQHDGQPRLARLLSNLALADKMLSVMEQHEGFKQVAWGALAMWFRHDTVNRRQIIRGRVVLEEPLEHALCLAAEVDLVTQWNHALADMQQLGAFSASELLVYVLMWMPWPLPAPEIINYALGLDLLSCRERSVVIAVESARPELLAADMELPRHPRTQRITLDAGGFRFRPLPPDPAKPHVPRTEVTVLVCIDASRFAAPDAVISFILKVFAPLVYKHALRVLSRVFARQARELPGAGRAASVCSSEAEPAPGAGGGSELAERLALKPVYAQVAAHAQRVLAATAAPAQCAS